MALDAASGGLALIEVFALPTQAAQKALTDAGQSVPAAVKLRAIIDTGANRTCVGAGVLASLGIAPIGTSPLGTASQNGVACPLLPTRLFFPTNQHHELVVAELPAKNASYDMLLGCDILSFGVFIYTGPSGTFTLCF